jgi:flagellar basal-body rod modification protein FlgD
MQIDSVAAPTQAQLDVLNAQNNARGGQKTLGVNDFLKLLTVQLQSQDPLKPMEDTAFISQMASFTSLEQMRTLSQDFADFTKEQRVSDASGYLGKVVTVTDAVNGDVTGLITGITIDGGTPRLLVNGTSYDLSSVKAVSAAALAPAPSASTAPTTPK